MKNRKRAHLELALQERDAPSYFAAYRLTPRALPELNFDTISTQALFLKKTLSLPLLISSMTAGIREAESLNRRLAQCAEEKKIGMGVGSLRKVLEEGKPFGVALRKCAPTALLLANLGAVQLNYGFGLAECQRAVEILEADALILHLNPMQEAIQPEGNRDFSALLPKIEQLVKKLPVPLIIKEVGQGLDYASAKKLAQVGVRYFDTAGGGGTSFAAIEAKRRNSRRLYELFADWGLDTPSALLQLKKLRKSHASVQIIASGGVRSGLDVAKSLALGADFVGMAKPFLQKALLSYNALVSFVDQLALELKLAMFGCGCGNLKEMKKVEVWNVKSQAYI